MTYYNQSQLLLAFNISLELLRTYQARLVVVELVGPTLLALQIEEILERHGRKTTKERISRDSNGQDCPVNLIGNRRINDRKCYYPLKPLGCFTASRAN